MLIPARPTNPGRLGLGECRLSLLAGHLDGSVLVYKLLQEGQGVLRPLAKTEDGRHGKAVTSVQWFPWDTGIFTTSSFDHSLKVWDTNRMKPACTFRLGARVYTQCLSPIATSHSLIAATSSDKVVLCDIRSGSSTHILSGHTQNVMSLAWSPRDEFMLASGGADRRVKLWDIRRAGDLACLVNLNQHYSGGPTPGAQAGATGTSHNGAVNGLCFSQDGLFLLSSGTEGRTRLWDVYLHKNTLVNYQALANSSRRTLYFALSMRSDPTVLFHPDKNKIRMLDMMTGEEIHTLTGHFEEITAVRFHPVHQELYSSGAGGEILVWTPLLHSNIDEDEGGSAGPGRADSSQDDWSD